MDWIISVSSAERARGELLPETAREATAQFRKHGCIVLRGGLAPGVVDAMHQEYLARFGGLNGRGMQAQAESPPPTRFTQVGDCRYEITLRMNGAFGSPEVIANPLLLRFLMPLLGEDLRLSSFTSVVSHPGAGLQHVHRDHAYLYNEPSVNQVMPVYAVNVSVPMIDVDMETGPTGIWPGSHMWDSQTELPPLDTVTSFPFLRGDCVLMDYRTLHAGLPNRGNRIRPIAYLVYARTWFFDEVNHPMRVSLDMRMEEYQMLPESIRPLLTRALAQNMRNRWLEVDVREADAVRRRPQPTSSKIGRNELCPCDSGKKYKHCHGQLVPAS